MNTKQMQQILSDADADAKIAADRNADIKIIQGEVEGLDAVIKDISVLTQEQGQTLDHIDDDVKKAVDNTKQGVDALEDASIKQEQRRKNTVAIFIGAVLSIALAIGGGMLIRGVLGMSGPVGLLAGAGIMLAGIAVLGGIGYGIYSLFKCFRPKPEKPADVIVESKPDLSKKNITRPAKTHSNVVKQELSDDSIFSLLESPTLTNRGMEVVRSEVASQVLKRF